MHSFSVSAGVPASTSRTLGKICGHIFAILYKDLQFVCGSVRRTWQFVLGFVGPEHDRRPEGSTVIVSLCAYALYLLVLCFAVVWPTHGLYILVMIICTLVSLALTTLLIHDLHVNSWSLSEAVLPERANRCVGFRLYRRNLGNSVLTVIFATITMTSLYGRQWYPELNSTKLVGHEDTVVGTNLALPILLCLPVRRIRGTPP